MMAPDTSARNAPIGISLSSLDSIYIFSTCKNVKRSKVAPMLRSTGGPEHFPEEACPGLDHKRVHGISP
jgi:hypothetical protein